MSDADFLYNRQLTSDITATSDETSSALINVDSFRTRHPTAHDKRYPLINVESPVDVKEMAMADSNLFNLPVPPRKNYDHVQDKELRKKLKNRESAQAARDRKKAKMMYLERQVSDLMERNRNLESENIELRNRIKMVDTGSCWKADSELYRPNQLNRFSDFDESTAPMAYSNRLGQHLHQASFQSPCSYISHPGDVPGSIPDANSSLIKRIEPTEFPEITAHSRTMSNKYETFTADNEVFGHQVQYFVAKTHSLDEGPHKSSLHCVSESSPKNYSHGIDTDESSAPSSSSSFGLAGDCEINSDDWLTSSLTADVQGHENDPDPAKLQTQSVKGLDEDQQSLFNSISYTDHRYSWEMQGDQCHRSGSSEKNRPFLTLIPTNAGAAPQVNNSYIYQDMPYCDSSGIESMSSPEGSGASSDICGGIKRAFFGDKQAFKVH